MKFSQAFDEAQRGFSITREAWGQGTRVVAQPGYPEGVALSAQAAQVIGEPVGTVVRFAPYLARCEHGTWVPWTPTQEDLFASDWGVN